MITPKDLKEVEIKKVDFDKLEAEIDESMKIYHGDYSWEQAIIEGEYSLEVRNEIARKYKAAGWSFVYHRTSSEVGDKSGLTIFLFSMKKLPGKTIQGYHNVNLYTPDDSISSDVDELSIKVLEGMRKTICISYVKGEYSLETRNEVAEDFKRRHGWRYVYHKTASEISDDFKVTTFIFSTAPLYPTDVEGYDRV